MTLGPGFGRLIGFSLIFVLSEAVQSMDGRVDQEDFAKLGPEVVMKVRGLRREESIWL